MVRHLSACYASLSQKVRLISSDPGAERDYSIPGGTKDGVIVEVDSGAIGAVALLQTPLSWNLAARSAFSRANFRIVEILDLGLAKRCADSREFIPPYRSLLHLFGGAKR